MSFLHFWPIYLGLGAAALPVAVHFLTRPKPVRFPLSTMRFVREAIHQRRARNKLRDVIILALRVLAVLLLAWAIARPLIGRPPPLAVTGDDVTIRVVLLDVSQSMAATERGIQTFERARSRAAEFLAYRPRLKANLLQAAAAPRGVFDRSSTNLVALRDELAAAAPRPERLNVRAALIRAAEMLGDKSSGSAQRELVIVSDFQRSNWSSANFSVLPAHTKIVLESVAPPEPPSNLGVLRVEFGRQAVEGRSTRCDVEVGNYSPTTRQVQVELTVGNSSLRLEGVCPAEESIVLGGDVSNLAPGWYAGKCHLAGNDDALAADDVRHFALEVRRPPTCALIARDAASAGRTSSYYLERAIAPLRSNEDGSGLRVTRFDPAQLDDERIETYDFVAVDHPGKLSEAAVRRLASLLRRGRGVMYIASEAADAVNLRQLAVAAEGDLQMPVEFAPPPAGAIRRDLFLVDVERDSAPFRVFGDSLVELISPLRFGGGLASRRLDGGSEADIAAVFSDRSAAIVVSPAGAGMLAVLNFDLNRSNLPGSSAFVPLVGELAERLIDRGALGAPLASGEPAAMFLPPDVGSAASLTIVGPDDSTGDDGEIGEDRLGVLWRMTAAGPPGIWQVRRDDATLFAAAITLPAEESDLRPLDPKILTERQAGGRAIEYRSADEAGGTNDTAWIWLATACVACMLTEVAALRGFRA